MKIISWNLNGINAASKKGLFEFVRKEDADIYCFQEIKSSPEKIGEHTNLEGYESFWATAERKGYSGLLVYSKTKPVSVIEGIGNEEFDKEARVLILEFENFFLINSYFPHSRRDLERLDFKLNFNKLFLEFCERLRKQKPVVIAADFNVAHKEIDLRNPKQNMENAGFTPQERRWFDLFLAQGYLDTFREFNSGGGHYTWWSYMYNARQKNIGWRIDYFVVSEELKTNLKNSEILKEVLGSDHCPIRLELDL
ncbi:exodeoxyribonuclease III [Candidatus Woesearchaeota archaeon]|nr:exodeoxyribonuclease III [Candidatus Woesearchaeota archaeon]